MAPRDAVMTAKDAFEEKSFYLDEFRRQTLLVAVPADAIAHAADAGALVEAVEELSANGTRLLLLWGAPPPHGRRHAAARVLSRILPPRTAEAQRKRWIEVSDGGRAPVGIALLRGIWRLLRDDGRAVIRVGPDDQGILADFAQRLAGRLGARKLVLVDREGGISNETGLVSFMDGAMLEELLRRGEAEWVGVGHRRPVLEAIRNALHGGVESVNLCDLDGVGRELFTYEGAGTLFTLADYCRVERLRVDEFPEVEKLLERGQREGYLRLRNADEIGDVLMCGYGATIGTGHLAGVCALATEPYRKARAGEIVGLYTITRFKGEGVGGKLLGRAVEDARQLGLRYVFACTTHDRARAFFERHGFSRATPAEVPADKWRTYDAHRRRRLTIYKLWLVPGKSGRGSRRAPRRARARAGA
jgi:N-acetylglutamate synthase-like GNAT family acetyltransferase